MPVPPVVATTRSPIQLTDDDDGYPLQADAVETITEDEIHLSSGL